MQQIPAALLLLGFAGCLSPLSTAEDAAAIPVADTQSGQLIRIMEDLRHHDLRPFLDAGATAVAAGALIPTADDPLLERPWTAALPRTIAALEESDRTRMTVQLDSWYRQLCASSPSAPYAALACDFLPAAQARADLAAAADLAFDRGDLRRSIAIDALLIDEDPLHRRRDAVALALLGVGREVDASQRMADPGMPASWPGQDGETTAPGVVAVSPDTEPAARQERGGLTIQWDIGPGRLLGLDPWGRPRWLRRIALNALVIAGPGAAIDMEPERTALVRESGDLIAITPGAGQRPLAVAGGAAWFVMGAEIQRWTFDGRPAAGFSLPAPPLGPPLVRGESSLWLTPDEVVCYDGAHLRARFHHRLVLGNEAHVGWIAGKPAIVSGGRRWEIPDLALQLRDAPPPRKALLLSLAERGNELLTLARTDPTAIDEPGVHGAALAACFAAGDVSFARTLARTPQDRAWIALAQLALSGGAGDPAATQTIAHEITEDPGLLLPGDARDLARDPAAWMWRMAGRAWMAARSPGARWPSGLPDGEVVEDRSRPRPAAVPPGTVTVADADGSSVIGWHETAGTLWWSRRWTAPPLISGTARLTHALNDGMLLIGEGASHLTVLDPCDGDLRARFELTTIDVDPAMIRILGPDARGSWAVAMLHPPGIRNQLLLADDTGREQSLPLGRSARWMVRAPGRQVLLVFTDGSAALATAEGVVRPVAVPSTLAQSRSADATAEGVVIGNMLLPWHP